MIDPAADRRNSGLASLRLTVPAIFTLLVALTAATITWLSYQSARNNVLTVSSSIMAQKAALSEARVMSLVSEAKNAAEMNARALNGGVLTAAELERQFFEQLGVYRNLTALIFGDQAGNFLMVQRGADGGLNTKRVVRDGETSKTTWQRRAPGAGIDDGLLEDDPTDAYDPRTRAWYTGAKEFGELVWTDAYVFISTRQPGVTVSMPLALASGIDGVVGVDLSLGAISQFLSELDISPNGAAYLVDHSGNLIASPRLEDVVSDTGSDGALKLLPVEQCPVPQLAHFGGLPEFKASLGGGTAGTARFEFRNEAYASSLRTVRISARKEWRVAALAPEDDFLGIVKAQNRKNLLIALLCSVLAIVASMSIARWIAASVQILMDQCRRIRSLDFGKEGEHLPTSPFREINDVLGAIGGMKSGLRSFQKYMPIKLVQQLLERNEEPKLGGVEMEITIFFSDVANFTTISEQLGPMNMAKRLGFYLGSLADTIQATQGTVISYIGDAVMAIWNAPVPVLNHPVNACRAALECQRVVDHLWDGESDPGPDFPTRIGLHTTTAAVGHFGSPDRMSYTTFGDGVNLAARLEGTNKVYGTRIIISEDTHEQVIGQFETRHLDLVVVKGRVGAIGIYELIAEKGKADAKRMQAARLYEEAFKLYLKRDWSASTAKSEAVLAIRPDDKAAKTLKERCQVYTTAPPPKDWNGAYIMTSK